MAKLKGQELINDITKEYMKTDVMEIPVAAIREYIVNAINIVVNISRLTDGKRKITSIRRISN